MKKLFILAAGLLVAGAAAAQPKTEEVVWPEYHFTTVKENPITSVKNQYRSGTCWCFSALGFVESEVIRINGITDKAQYPDFSEMFVVSHSYQDRAEKYVRLDGKLQFAAGSEADDVLDVIRDYGLVPQEVMPGMKYGTELPEQAELDAVARSYVESVAANPNRTLTTAWKNGFKGIMDSYLGECPTEFEYQGVKYTPASYRDALKFNPDDYVSLTSYTHHPFYTSFAIEVCDNWRWDRAYNIPIDELMQVLDDALEAGYTAAWGADVSQKGFTRDGLAVLVDLDALKKNAAGSDQEKWVGKDDQKKPAKVGKGAHPVEYEPTQEMRQLWFDNKTVTDDHGMQIYGIAKDQWDHKFYLVKNSWGETGKYKGIWYATENFVKGQTIDIVLHKDALPQALKDKLGIR